MILIIILNFVCSSIGNKICFLYQKKMKKLTMNSYLVSNYHAAHHALLTALNLSVCYLWSRDLFCLTTNFPGEKMKSYHKALTTDSDVDENSEAVSTSSSPAQSQYNAAAYLSENICNFCFFNKNVVKALRKFSSSFLFFYFFF